MAQLESLPAADEKVAEANNGAPFRAPDDAGDSSTVGDEDGGDEADVAPSLSAQSLDLMFEASTAGKGDKLPFRTPAAPKGDRLPVGVPTAPGDGAPKIPMMPRADDGGTTVVPRREDQTAAAVLLPDRVPHSASRPTVVIPDKYRDVIVDVGTGGFSHGELSARMAEESGYNVVRMEFAKLASGGNDTVGTLRDINRMLDSGEMVLKPGDVVNFSFEYSTTFQNASDVLGLTITPENVRAMRGEILAAARRKLEEPNVPEQTRILLNTTLAINEGITKLQERGLKVVASGGNNGPGQFSIGFMNADEQYAALTADGKPADYSARNSLTTVAARGDVDLFLKPLNAFDPTPFERQQGTYRLDGTNIHISAAEFGGSILQGPVTNYDFSRALFFNTTTLTGAHPTATFEHPNVDSWTKGTIAVTAQGTSYVNIFARKPFLPPT